MTSKEALNFLKWYISEEDIRKEIEDITVKERIGIIQKDLERLECIENVLDNIANRLKLEVKNIFTLETEIFNRLEVLEILKNKRVNINKISKAGKLENYNSICAIGTDLTFEEYKAIKNWLERKE